MSINAYPCQWPEGWKRTSGAARKQAWSNKASAHVLAAAQMETM